MATLFRERIFYTWLILDLLTLRSEPNGAKAACPLSISPQPVELEYGKSVHLKCNSSTLNEKLSWTFSNIMINESTIVMNSSWLINLLGWHGNASCHGRFLGLDDCHKDVNVTVYQQPDQVSISTFDPAGPITEGRNFELQCDIKNVAPVQFLIINWYKGKELVKNEYVFETKNPANITRTLNISLSRDHSKIQYSCEAELKLGPKSSLKVHSNLLNFTVHYKPKITGKLPRQVPVFHGYPEVLVCEASGYPEPNITWIFDDKISIGGKVNVTNNGGTYTCIASNSVGNDTKVVTVVMKEDYLPLIAGLVALMVVIISVVFISIYFIYYTNTKMGHYTIEGAKPKAQNGNIAQNGKDSTIPMKKILV